MSGFRQRLDSRPRTCCLYSFGGLLAYCTHLTSIILAFLSPQFGLHTLHSDSAHLPLVAFIVASTLIIEVIVWKRRLSVRWRQTNECHAFADACPDGFLVIDTKLKIEFANQIVTKMFGYTVDELIGKAVSLLHPEFGTAQ